MRAISSLRDGSATSEVERVATSALPMVSKAICAHQPLPSRSPAAPYVMLVPLVFWYGVFDLKSVNFSVTGSNITTPSGAEAQILPLPSTSMVTAPPSGDIGGLSRNFATFSRCTAITARPADHLPP